MRPFLAYIMPVGEGPGGPVDPGYSPPWARPNPRPPGGGGQPPYPDQGLPGGQPYPDQGLPGFQPYPDQGLPGSQPHPDQGLPGGQGGRPTHPIYYPPGTRPHPDQGLPGSQPRPDQGLPPFPSHPIYIPGPGEPPLGIWGPTDPRPTPPIVIPPGTPTPTPPGVPTHPIVLPPDLPPVDGENRLIDWKTAWTPQTGWVVIGVPAEGTLVPTPSK